MNGLGTSAVLVVDDDQADAVPLIQSLAAEGVGSLYLSGDPGQFPRKGTLRGIRLAVLDVDLLGLDRPPEEMVKDPLRVLDAVITRDNGPYMALLWTTNDTVEELFQQGAATLEWPPVATCVLSKSEVRNGDDFDLPAIAARVGERLADVDPLRLMMLWGQTVHDAAAATLVSLGPEPGEAWVDEVRDLLGTLVRENTPKPKLKDLERCVRGLFDALDQVHTDHLEQAADRVVGEDCRVIDRVAKAAASSTTTKPDLLAKVNRSLLLGPVIEAPAPGTVYLIEAFAKTLRADFKQLVHDTLEEPPATTTDAKRTAYQVALEAAVPIAIELTPVCDHQQDSHHTVRLLGGVALPETMAKLIKPKADYVRRLPTIAFDDEYLQGHQVIALNAHFLVVRARSALVRQKARYRIRQAPLADLFAFNSGHSSRPGYLAIRK